MLKNAEIISMLTEEQKVALVADVSAASGDAFGGAGVPHLEKTELDALNANGGEYVCPDLASLASAWNPKLLEFVTGCVLSRSDVRKHNLIGTPQVSLKTGPCAGGLTEDPYLNTQTVAAFASGIAAAGGTPYYSGCAIGNADTEYLDGNIDDGVMYNLLTRALFDALALGRHGGAEISCKPLKGDRKGINGKLAEKLRGDGRTKTLLVREMPEELFLSALTDKNTIFAGASPSSLRSALKNYVRMKEDVEHGAIGAEELEKAVSVGTAVSAERLDEAVDNVIEFIKSSAARQPAAPPRTADECRNAALYAARESIVLLKNNGVLPLLGKTVAKVAVVGELANEYVGAMNTISTVLGKHGISVVGFENGYKFDEERSDAAVPAAAELASGADAVLVFVGLGRNVNGVKLTRHESINLPANQFALLDAIRKTGKKVIAAVVGNVLPDMKFDDTADGIINVPFGGAQTMRALAEIVAGDVCPSGRLVSTAYVGADEYFAAQRGAVTAGRYKIGEFVGYRRYVSERTDMKYPFGFGLSYCKFHYSGLKVASDSVEVTVKNVGSMSGAEVVQLYIGKKSSAVVRPVRELKGFVKVFVDAGKSAQIRFPLNSELFEIFDRTDGKRKVESGDYGIFVGASATDIKLTGSITMSGVKLENGSDKLADYLPTVTNIVDGGYQMNSVSQTPGSFRSARPDDGDVTYERLFADEFAEADDDDESYETSADEEEDIFNFLDESINAVAVAEGLIRCGRNVGINIDRATATELIAAFSASRVVMLRCEKSEFDLLVSVLCEYVGCPLCVDNAAKYAAPDDLFADGGSSLVSGISYAAAHRESMMFAALDGVHPDALGKFFTPFIRYATAPDRLRVTFGTAKRALEVPRNMWFLMRLSDGRCEFPAYVADMGAVLFPSVTAIEPVDSGKVYAPNFFQFVAACRRSETRFELEEAQWKKIDALEKYVAARVPFKMGNKLCVQTEKFSSVLLECGVNQFETLDAVVAAKLVPHIATVLEGKIPADEGGLDGAFNGIFGEDDTNRIKLAVRKAVGKDGGA